MPAPEENPQAETAPTPDTTPITEAPAATKATETPAPSSEHPATPTAPTTAAPAAPATPTTPAARPLPEFGEYAPEGWEWKPEEPVAGSAVAGAQGSTANTGGTPGTVPGVPHNLGAGSTLPKKNARAAATQQTGGAPYMGTPPANPGNQPANNLGAQGAQSIQGADGAPAKRTNRADRIVTTLLLTLGAFGALQSAFAMFGIKMQFAMMGEVLGVADFTVPGWLDVTGKIAGIAVLAFYALMLVYSIRRLRAGKLTFWVPLVAGFIAIVALFILSMAALTSSPDLIKALSDPDATAKLLDYIQTLQSTPKN